jgi:hypothetical protein
LEDYYHGFQYTPPSNITNLFGNWLNGVAKKKTKATLELMCAHPYRPYGLSIMILSLTKTIPIFSVGYFFGYPLRIHMWYFFQPADDRHDMDIRCNRLAMATQDCYS